MVRRLSFISVFLVGCLLLLPALLSSQIDPEVEARKELEKRNLNEEELRTRLLQKGIDVDNLANLSGAEALEVQQTIEATIAEMEREQQTRKNEVAEDNNTDTTTPRIDPKEEEQLVVEKSDSTARARPDTIPGKIYGQHLFLNKSLAVYNQSSDIKPEGSYIIGPKDELVVSIWGLSRKEEAMTVSADGYVKPGRMPRIYLKGFSLDQAVEILKQRYKRYYRFRSNEFDVAVKYSRVIEVNIFGEVNHYGGFTLPAVNTAFNALVAAGGPTELGSVRKIKVIRGRQVRVLDVYEYMSDPRSKTDYYLQDNDIIQVPFADFVVDIRGAVQRPFRYELIAGEGLLSAIEYAGGLKDNALKSRIRILRYVDDKQVLIDANYGDLKLNRSELPLLNGDVVIVDEIKVAQRNVVSVSGEIDYGGKYDLNNSNQLSQLLPKVGLNRRSRKDLAFIKRSNPNQTYSFIKLSLVDVLNGVKDEVLFPGDELIIFSLAQFVDETKFVVSGAVRLPDTFPYNYEDRILFSEAIMLAGGLRSDAQSYAYITRFDSADINKRQYIQVDINGAMGGTAKDIQILPNDVVTVGSKLTDQVETFVDVSGAVNSPGRYEYGNEMTIVDAILLAGGMSFNAASNRVDIFRVVIQENEPTKTVVATIQLDRELNPISSSDVIKLSPYDQIVVREVPEFEFQQNVEINGQVRYPGVYSLTGDNERLNSLIERAGGFTNEAFAAGASLFRTMDSIGYVVVDMEEAINRPSSMNNILLKEGDVIEVPKQMDLVRIIGFTNARELYPDNILTDGNGIAVPFNSGKNAKYYIDEFAAGVSDEGDLCTITVEHANGQIESVKNYGLFRSYPEVKKGSIIRVSAKKKSERQQRKDDDKEDVDWGKIFANSVAQATTILSLILLLQRID